MRKWVLTMLACFLLAGCSGKQAVPEGEQLNFSMIVHGDEEEQYSKEEQVEIEKTLRGSVGKEPIRLLYFYEDFEEELSQESAIEIRYDEPQTIGSVEADRIVLFLSGRLKADASAENNPIVTVHNQEVLVWNGQLGKMADLLNN